MNNNRNKIPYVLAGIILVIILIVLARLFIFNGNNSSEIEKNVDKLKSIENEDVSTIENQIRESDTSTEAATAGTAANDTDAQNQATNNPYSDSELAQHYQGTVIMGDSITNSIVEYGILDRDVVVSAIGLSVAKADDEIATAIELNPTRIIMCFGANDLETYESKTDLFIDAYTKQIKKLQSALPNSQIYINGILPIKESRIEETPALQYYKDYNTALQQMCTDLGCIYIDSSFIINNDPSLYEPDGEHLVYKFYNKWLTYMALKVGI